MGPPLSWRGLVPKLTRLWLAPAALSIVAIVLPGRGLARRAFERRVSVLFGIDSRLARELLAAARTRRRERYVVRSMAFLLATTRVSPRVLPLALRAKAIQSFVGWLLAWHPE